MYLHEVSGSDNEVIGFGVWGSMGSVLCHDCVVNVPSEDTFKIFRINIGSYGQTCHVCDKTLVVAHQGWPELYTKRS